MQIRELTLKELYPIYGLISELYSELTYNEFEDLIYDMRYMEYKMIGILEKNELVSYAGVVIQTTFKDKRHLKVFDFFAPKKYDKMMREFLSDYAKTAMCEKVIYAL